MVQEPIPYIIKLAVDDSDIRKSMAKIDWAEMLGLEKGKILTQALKSDAKTASDAIERELDGTNINWKQLLGEELFEKLVTKITKQAREIRDSLKGWINNGDIKKAQEALDIIEKMGQSFREIGGDFNAKSFFTAFAGMIDTVGKFEKKVTSLEGTLKRIQTTFGVTFNDKGGIAKTSSGIERIGKALLVMGSDKSAINNLKGIKSELNKIESKSTIKIKADIDEGELSKLWNKQMDALSGFDDLTIDDLIKDLDSYKDKAKELIPIIANLLEIDKKAKKLGFGSFIEEAIDIGDLGFDEFYDEKEARKAMRGMISTLQQEVDKGSKKVSEAFERLVSGINEVEVDLTLTQKTKDELKESINNYVKDLNEGGEINTVKVKAVLDRIRKDNLKEDVPKIEDETKENKPTKQKKYGDEVTSSQVKKVKTKIENEIAKLQVERDALEKELKRQEEPREDKRGYQSAGQTRQKNLLEEHIKEYRKTIESYQEIQKLMNEDPQYAAEITKEWNSTGDSFSGLEVKQKAILTKTEVWKTRMVKALSISSQEVNFDFEDAGKTLAKSIQAYLDDPENKIRLQIDAEHLASQIKNELEHEGINLGGGGSGGNVHLDAKELYGIVAAAMNSALTGAPAPSFESAPQEQQAEVVEEVAQETEVATETTKKYVKVVDESTIGVGKLVSVLKEFASVATAVKFNDDGTEKETAPKYVKELSAELANYGIDVSKIKGATTKQIIQIIQDALFAQRSDLSATGDIIPGLIDAKKRRGKNTSNDQLIATMRHALAEVLENNGVSLRDYSEVVKRERSIDVAQSSMNAGRAKKTLGRIRGRLYPEKELDPNKIPSIEEIQGAINIFEDSSKEDKAEIAVLTERFEKTVEEIKSLEKTADTYREIVEPQEAEIKGLEKEAEAIRRVYEATKKFYDEIKSIKKPTKKQKTQLATLGQELAFYKNEYQQTMELVETKKEQLQPSKNVYQNTMGLIQSKRQQANSILDSLGLYDTTELQKLKMAREELGDKRDDDSIAKFKVVADEFWKNTLNINEALKVLHGELKARITLDDNIEYDIDSPANAAKLLKLIQEGRIIVNAEVYEDPTTKALDTGFAGNKGKREREEKRLLYRDGYAFGQAPYLSEKPEGFGSRWKYNPLNKDVDVKGFNKKDIKVKGTPVDLDGQIQETQQTIENNKAELQQVETELQNIDAQVKKQQANVKRKKTELNKLNVDVESIDITEVNKLLDERDYKTSLLEQISGGELLNSNLYPAISDKMQNINKMMEERQLKEEQLKTLDKLTEKEIRQILKKSKEDADKVKEYKKDPSIIKRLPSTYGNVDELARQVDSKEWKSYRKLYIDFLKNPDATKSALKNEISNLGANETNQRSAIQEWAKSEMDKMSQATKDIQKKAKPLMDEYKQLIDNLYEKAMNAGTQLADSNISGQKRTELLGYLNNVLETLNTVQGEYEAFAKRVNLKPINISKQKQKSLNELSSTYLTEGQSAKTKRQQAATSAEDALTTARNNKSDIVRRRDQLEAEIQSDEAFIIRLNAQKEKQEEINKLKEQEKKLTEDVEDLIRDNASNKEIQEKKNELKEVRNELQAIYDVLEKTGGVIHSVDPVKYSKEEIQSEAVDLVNKYQKQIEILKAQKKKYDDKYNKLEKREKEIKKYGLGLESGEAKTEAENVKKAWADEYIRSSLDVRTQEASLKDIFEFDLDRIEEPIRNKYEREIEKGLTKSGFKTARSQYSSKEEWQAAQQEARKAFLSSEAGQTIMARYNQELEAATQIAKEEYYKQLNEMHKDMRQQFIDSLEPQNGVLYAEYAKVIQDEDGGIDIITEIKEENIVEKLLQDIKNQKQVLKKEHKPSEIEKKLEDAIRLQQEAKEYGQFNDETLLDPTAVKQQLDYRKELLQIDKQLDKKREELEGYTKKGLNKKDPDVKRLNKEIEALEARQKQLREDIANRNARIDEKRAQEGAQKPTLSKEEQLAQALERRAQLQEKLAQSTDKLTKAQQEYNEAKGTDKAAQAHYNLEQAIKYQQRYQQQLTNTEARIKRLTGEVEKEKEVATTIAPTTSGSNVQGGLIGAIVSAIKEALSSIVSEVKTNTSHLATEETLRAIHDLLGGDWIPEDEAQDSGLSRNKKKTADVTKTSFNPKELNKVAYEQSKDIIKNITDEKSAVDAITESVERLKQLTNENKQDTEEYIVEQRKLGTILAKSYFGMNPQKVKGTGKDGQLKWEDLKANDKTLKKLGVWDYNPLTSNDALAKLVGGEKLELPLKEIIKEQVMPQIKGLGFSKKQVEEMILKEIHNDTSGNMETAITNALQKVTTEIVQRVVQNHVKTDDSAQLENEKKKTEETKKQVENAKQETKEEVEQTNLTKKTFKAEFRQLVSEIGKYEKGSTEQKPLQEKLLNLVQTWIKSPAAKTEARTGKDIAAYLESIGIKGINPNDFALTQNKFNKMFADIAENATNQVKEQVEKKSDGTHPSTPKSSGVQGGIIGAMRTHLAQESTLQKVLITLGQIAKKNAMSGKPNSAQDLLEQFRRMLESDAWEGKERVAYMDLATGSMSNSITGDNEKISAKRLKVLREAYANKMDMNAQVHTHADEDDPYFSPEDLKQFGTEFANGIMKQILLSKNNMTVLDMTDVKDVDGLLKALAKTEHNFEALATTADKFGAKYVNKAFSDLTPQGLVKMLGIKGVESKLNETETHEGAFKGVSEEEAKEAAKMLQESTGRAIKTTVQRVGVELETFVERTDAKGNKTFSSELSNKVQKAMEVTNQNIANQNLGDAFGLGTNAEKALSEYENHYAKLHELVEKFKGASKEEKEGLQAEINALLPLFNEAEKKLLTLIDRKNKFIGDDDIITTFSDKQLKNTRKNLEAEARKRYGGNLNPGSNVAFGGYKRGQGSGQLYVDVLKDGTIRQYVLEVDRATGQVKEYTAAEHALSNAFQNVNKAMKQNKTVLADIAIGDGPIKQAEWMAQASSPRFDAYKDAFEKMQNYTAQLWNSSKSPSQQQLDYLMQLSERVMALGKELQKTSGDFKDFWDANPDNVVGIDFHEDDTLRSAMERYAQINAGANNYKYDFESFDNDKLNYKLTDAEGRIYKVSLVWDELYKKVAIVSNKSVAALDPLVQKIENYKKKIEDAKTAGYLSKDSDRAFNQAIQKVAELEQQVDGTAESFKRLEEAREKAAGVGAGLDQTITSNKRKVGTNAVNSVKAQYDKIIGSRSAEGIKNENQLVKQYNEERQKLIDKYNKYVKTNKINNPKIQEELRQQAAGVQKLGRELLKSTNEAEKLQQAVDDSGTYTDKNGEIKAIGSTRDISAEEANNISATLKAWAKELYGADLQNAKVNTTTKTLTGTLRVNNRVVKDVAIQYNKASEQAYAFEKAERESLSGFPAFMKGLKEKTKAIAQYLFSMTSIYRVIGEVRKGIQYIKEIDLALVELRKVTDETEEAYDKFLNTAAQTADRLGSTISGVTEATATFAKLGYTMKMATEMAESAIVYKNVGDGIASTEDAANSIISTLKGFGLEASESMRIVDRFNEVGE